MDSTPAVAEITRRKVKRAGGLLKEVARELAALTDDMDTVDAVRVHDEATCASAAELAALAVAHYGAADVIVIARPGRRGTTPTTAPDGAKESNNGNADSEREGRAGRSGAVVVARA